MPVKGQSLSVADFRRVCQILGWELEFDTFDGQYPPYIFRVTNPATGIGISAEHHDKDQAMFNVLTLVVATMNKE